MQACCFLVADYGRVTSLLWEVLIMARFKIGDRVKVNATIGAIYDKVGTIVSHGQVQMWSSGQCYSMPSWKIQLDNGDCISLNEKYLNRV